VRIPGRYRTPIPRTLLVVAVLVVAAVASLVFGSYQMSPEQVFRLIFNGEGTEIERQLVLNQRLPRMLAAVVVGAALGLSGAIFQSVSRNALGSPDIIGFTVGSATGALSVVLIGSLSSTGVGWRYYWRFCDGGCGDASGGCARWRDDGSKDGADRYCGECDAQFRERLPDYAR